MDIFNEVDIDSLCGHCTDFADELKEHNDNSSEIPNPLKNKLTFPLFSYQKCICGCP